MPQVDVSIGGRSFEVACGPGEEAGVREAAALLDAEAQKLVASAGRMPAERLLLLAGLLLADRTSEEKRRADAAEARVSELENRPAPQPERIEVPVVPKDVTEALAEIAARAEALADRVEAASQ